MTQQLSAREPNAEQIEEQEKTISKARILYLSEKFEFDDFSRAKAPFLYKKFKPMKS